MRGRKPKPLSLQISEGDTRKRGARKLKQASKAQRRGDPFLPPAPGRLNAEEKADYEAIKVAIDGLGLADASDATFVELAAIAVSKAREKASGESLRTAHAFLSSLGCGGPVSRARLPIEKSDHGEKDLMAMLSAPRAPRKIAVQ